jgi:hypothetical protein
MLGRGKAGQALQKAREGGGVRGEGCTRVHWIRGVGGVAALEDGRVKAQDLSLYPSSISDVGTSGGRLDRLQTGGAAMTGFGGKVKGPCLLLLDQWRMGPQGNPCSRPRIQALDLAAAGLNRGPILGGKGVGNTGGEKSARLAAFGGKEQRKGGAEIPNELPIEAPAREGGGGGKAAMPTVSRRRRKAWWSEGEGMYRATRGRDSRRGGR